MQNADSLKSVCMCKLMITNFRIPSTTKSTITLNIPSRYWQNLKQFVLTASTPCRYPVSWKASLESEHGNNSGDSS